MTFATVSTYVPLIFLLAMYPALRGFGHDDHAHKDEKPLSRSNDAAHDHDDHDHDHDEETLRLSKAAQARFDIKISEAGTRPLFHEVKLTGEIAFNEDQLVHLAPRLSGVIRDVHFSTGDRVAAGALMAVLDSRELAEAKADFMAAHSREQLADKVYSREKALFEKGSEK